MLDGEINSIVTEKGFGFIKSKAGGADVFFHVSALNVELDRVSVGQPVQFELDKTGDKPRAAKVVALGELLPPSANSGDARKQGFKPRDAGARGGSRGNSSRQGDGKPFHRRERSGPGERRGRGDRQGRERPPRDDRPLEYGFVTKLHRKLQRGFISSVKHGPEYSFEARSVRGEKSYAQLEPGDYVQFVEGRPDPTVPDHPIAIRVEVTLRHVKIPDAVPSVGRHPKARRRKPSWR